MASESVFAMHNVDIAYGRGKRRHFAATDVNLHVGYGETVALVGESGSGKSTVARAALRLLEPVAGQILLDGSDITHMSDRALKQHRRKMHMILQDPRSSLNPRQRIGKILSHPLKTHGVGTSAIRQQMVQDILTKVRLPLSFADRFGVELSGGQQQRVGIGRALILRPSFIVADEPVSALDTLVRAEVLDVLKERQREDSFGCLFITHDISVAQAIADRVIVMSRGKIIEQGTTEEIFERPKEQKTRDLIAAAPIPDPALQRKRRRKALESAS